MSKNRDYTDKFNPGLNERQRRLQHARARYDEQSRMTDPELADYYRDILTLHPEYVIRYPMVICRLLNHFRHLNRSDWRVVYTPTHPRGIIESLCAPDSSIFTVMFSLSNQTGIQSALRSHLVLKGPIYQRQAVQAQVEWTTNNPPISGYYLATWVRGIPPEVLTVSELWFNSISTKWFAKRGYIDDSMRSIEVKTILAWTNVPTPFQPPGPGQIPPRVLIKKWPMDPLTIADFQRMKANAGSDADHFVINRRDLDSLNLSASVDGWSTLIGLPFVVSDTLLSRCVRRDAWLSGYRAWARGLDNAKVEWDLLSDYIRGIMDNE